jgi:hypothetical protein
MIRGNYCSNPTISSRLRRGLTAGLLGRKSELCYWNQELIPGLYPISTWQEFFPGNQGLGCVSDNPASEWSYPSDLEAINAVKASVLRDVDLRLVEASQLEEFIIRLYESEGT